MLEHSTPEETLPAKRGSRFHQFERRGVTKVFAAPLCPGVSLTTLQKKVVVHKDASKLPAKNTELPPLRITIFGWKVLLGTGARLVIRWNQRTNSQMVKIFARIDLTRTWTALQDTCAAGRAILLGSFRSPLCNHRSDVKIDPSYLHCGNPRCHYDHLFWLCPALTPINLNPEQSFATAYGLVPFYQMVSPLFKSLII